MDRNVRELYMYKATTFRIKEDEHLSVNLLCHIYTASTYYTSLQTRNWDLFFLLRVIGIFITSFWDTQYRVMD